MSKLSKALDKYRKENNLTATQISSLQDTKAAKKSRPPKRPTLFLKREARSQEPSASIKKSPREIKPASKSEQAPAPAEGKESVRPVTKQVEQAPAAPSEPAKAGIPLNRYSQNLVSIVNPGCIESEIFKVLRAKILFPTAGSPPKSILITSAAPGEGKSFTASNLAVNLAQNIENHVLLMDCDLRRPTIHKLFGFGTVEGLSENLSNGNGLSSLFLKTGIGKLTVLPSGKPPANPSELLSSEKMAALIEELKNRYDDRFLIIDSPPPIVAPETTALAKHVDGIILVIKSGSTPLHLVEELIDNLGREKILGAVINRYDSRISFGSYGYKKYSKYYRS